MWWIDTTLPREGDTEDLEPQFFTKYKKKVGKDTYDRMYVGRYLYNVNRNKVAMVTDRVILPPEGAPDQEYGIEIVMLDNYSIDSVDWWAHDS